MTGYARVVAVLTTAAMGGCANPSLFADPQEITLAAAMDSTACSLATYRNSVTKYRVRPGTLVETVEVNFAVKGSAKTNSDLVIDSKFGEIGPLSALGVNYSNKNETVGERGNTVKIVMRNMYTVQLNKAGEKVVTRDGPPLARDGLSPVVFDKPCDVEGRRVVGPNIDPGARNAARLAARGE